MFDCPQYEDMQIRKIEIQNSINFQNKSINLFNTQTKWQIKQLTESR